MAELRQYNTATTIVFPLVTFGATDYTAAAAYAAGDVKISKDEGAFANITNGFTHVGNGIYALTPTATEMAARRVVITIIDQTSPKVWADQCVIIDTYGSGNGQHATNLNAGNVTWGQVLRAALTQAGSGSTSIVLDAAASAVDDIYNGLAVAITSGTGAGQARLITDYNGTTKTATVDRAWITTPGASATFVLMPTSAVDVALFGNAAGTFSGGRPEVNASHIAGDATAAANAKAFHKGAFITGSVSDASPLVTDFTAAAGLSASDDFYNGSTLVFTSGALAGIARRVIDYTGLTRSFDFTGQEWPVAPADNDTFIIIGRIEA